MKWEIRVSDISGTTASENFQLSQLYKDGWELITVASLPLFRRAYLKREIPETPTSKPEMHDLVSMVEHHQVENS